MSVTLTAPAKYITVSRQLGHRETSPILSRKAEYKVRTSSRGTVSVLSDVSETQTKQHLPPPQCRATRPAVTVSCSWGRSRTSRISGAILVETWKPRPEHSSVVCRLSGLGISPRLCLHIDKSNYKSISPCPNPNLQFMWEIPQVLVHILLNLLENRFIIWSFCKLFHWQLD